MRQLKSVILDEIGKLKRECARNFEDEKKTLQQEVNSLQAALKDARLEADKVNNGLQDKLKEIEALKAEVAALKKQVVINDTIVYQFRVRIVKPNWILSKSHYNNKLIKRTKHKTRRNWKNLKVSLLKKRKTLK
jgi:hypothetical protein